ncbi:MAG: alcohol dehydrogenase catalytic domain-containing protein, partial [Cyclobacteriaceae bacterium]
MKKIAIVRYGNALEAFQFENQAEPLPNDAEILVKVEGFGLNYADVMARNGLYKEAPPIPFVPGYEIVGTVVKQGKAVPEHFKGKRVVALTR